MWEHKPHTKNKRGGGNHFNSPHETVNNLNSSHIFKNQDSTYYCNKREKNRYGNQKIDITPGWKKKREINGDSSNKSPLFVISARIFKCSSTIQPRPITLHLDNGLPAIHMIVGTSDTNEVTFCNRVNSCAGMNSGDLKIYQWIITTNPEIVGINIQFDDKNPFEPIRLNFPLEEENKTI